MGGTDRRCFLDALGGEEGCLYLAKNFYSRVATSQELRPLFPGKSLRCATEEFAAFLIQFLDGDPDKTQYRSWLSLRESHARFQISDRQRAAWLELIGETLHSVVKDVETREALQRFFPVAAAYIVGKAAGETQHEELRQRWEQQLAVDQLIEQIAEGRDLEALALARRLVSRPCVFAGILARLMEAGREPFIEFVLENVQNDRHLGERRYNGRTLLHFAAGSACLPVVRQLLSAGVDPDILDGGGHSPLYRAKSPDVVRELVRAGATVDHVGGVNRSTALHEAARHGRLRVAEALLDAGANPRAKDKKGLTPLDRARNCRRRDVAALLETR